MKHKKAYVVLAVVAATHLLCHAAYGDPAPTGPTVPGFKYVHILSDFDVKTSGGYQLHLPAGYFLDEPAWKLLDASYKAKADSNTSLTAENKALKDSMSGWQPGWYTLAATLAAGLVGGWYLHDKL